MVQIPLLQRFRTAFHQFRYSLSFVEALPQLTFLGLLVGLLTGLIIIGFRLCIEWPLSHFLPAGPDSFEGLSPGTRVTVICGGTIALYLLLKLAGKARSEVSVGHVLDRLHNFQGSMPASNWYVQFVGGFLSIVTGQSVGREGPAIHLGAGVSSRLARWLRLPHNSRYTLVACGVAAAIAASFDTPMAGVIFAMEVILMEYTIIGFVPVILASVTGAALSQAVFGDTAPLLTSQNDLESLLELPVVVAAGFFIALAAAAFIRLHIRVIRLGHWPLSLRLCCAAALTSAIAYYVPEVMGLGYDTINRAVAGEMPPHLLLLVAVAKLVATAVAVGLGVPGGVIGPTLVMGACIGGAFGYGVQLLYSTATADPGFYVILGMAGMMAAVLNAPLAALVAVLELSYNPHMIFPSMLVIVIACVSTRYFFKLDGIYLEQLKSTGRTVAFRPAQQALKKAGVAQGMITDVTYTNRRIDYDQAKALLTKKPQWLVLDFNEQGTRDKVALNAADLAAYLDEAPVEVLSLAEEIDLLGIRARRLILSPIHEAASLWEALEALRNTRVEGLYVARVDNPLTASIRGIVTTESITNFYQA